MILDLDGGFGNNSAGRFALIMRLTGGRGARRQRELLKESLAEAHIYRYRRRRKDG